RRLPPTGSESTSGEQGASGTSVVNLKATNATTGQSAPSALLPPALPTGVQSKQVGSRTFELEYQLENVGRWGVSRVELWGTRNGGQTWRRYTEDSDLRSPMRVTVEDEGRYGFRILAEAAGGTPPAPPQPGDKPEL